MFRIYLPLILGILLVSTIQKSFAFGSEVDPANLAITKPLQSGTSYAEKVESLARTKPELALQIATDALIYFKTVAEPEQQGRVLNASSYALYFLTRYEESMHKAKEAESIAIKFELGAVLARSRMLQGNVLQMIGEYTRAIKQYMQASTYYKRTDNKLYQSYVFNNIANTYLAANLYPSALEYYEKSNSIIVQSSALKGIGDTLFFMDRIEEALEYFQKSLDLYRSEGDTFGIAIVRNGQGDVYLALDDPQKSLELYEEAITLAKENRQIYTIEYSTRGKAKALFQLGRLEEAMTWAERATDIAAAQDDKASILENLELKSKILKAEGHISEALDALVTFNEMQNNYKTERDKTQLIVMQALFESETKAEEIEELEEKNKVLELEKQVKRKQNQYTLLMAAGLAGALTFLAFWAWTIYREKRRLALLSEELDKARLVAVQATQTKSAFLANMSHEIRTPLTSIIGYADSILQGDIAKQEQQRVVGIISENGSHLLHVINDILDFTKIEANKMEFEDIATPLFPLFSQIESVTGKRARDKGLNFDLHFQYPLPSSIVTDPTRLRQILFNLTNNALKFTNKGSISVSVKTVADTLSVSVRDTGIGITAEQQKILFTPFKQADGSINRRFGGSGLGLSISKHLAEGLGGQITLISETGKGSEFILSVAMKPAKDCVWVDNPEDASYTHKSQSSAQRQTRDYAGAKVLLAEDHPNNRELICLMLRRLKVDVTSVENGLQACDTALKNDFDLVLMDIQMPVMDGIQALKQLRAMQPNIPVIALTANNMKHEIDQYMEEGFNGHVPKPLDKDALISALDTFLKDVPPSSTPAPVSQKSLPRRDANLPDTHENLTGLASKTVSQNTPVRVTDVQDITPKPLVGSDDEFVLLTRDYIGQLQENIIATQQAWDIQDIEELQELAHKVKGSAGAFGLKPFGDAYDLIEHKLKNSPHAELDEEIEHIARLARTLLKVPGADVALGVQNHSVSIDNWITAIKEMLARSGEWFDGLSVAITQDDIAVFEILNPLCRDLSKLALPALYEKCQRLKMVVRQGNDRQKIIEAMAGISEQLKKLHEFFDTEIT